MSPVALTPSHLRVLVEQIQQLDPKARAIGIHNTRPWSHSEALEIDDRSYAVSQANTVLEIREALDELEREEKRVVVLTGLNQNDLGEDVVARMARCRLFPADEWNIVRDLFRAKRFDPALPDKCVAEALIENAPRDGYPATSTGVLDAGTIWRAVFRHVLEMGDREPDLVSLLLWGVSGSVTRYLSANEELRKATREQLTKTLGRTADSILRFIDGGYSTDCLALALVCGLVIENSDRFSELDKASARLEKFHGDTPIPKGVAAVLGAKGKEAIEELDRSDDPSVAAGHLARTDYLLKAIQADPFAYLSDLTPNGFKQRLARYGEALRESVENPTEETVGTCEVRLQEISDHRQASQTPEQVVRAKMALRLLRWLSTSRSEFCSFNDLSNEYIHEISFADWARETIHGGGDVAALSEAYDLIDKRMQDRRGEFNKRFAVSLRDWEQCGADSGEVFGVEHVLSRVIVPLVQSKNKVLLIVMDGMSWAICHELLDDIQKHHLGEPCWVGSAPTFQPVAATVPSVTDCSRASLLSGELLQGQANDEKKNFATHLELVAACDKDKPPVLFHKGDITEGTRGDLAPDVRKAIHSSKHKVVGVVINAIDDHLKGASQLRETWTVDKIRPLGALLRGASESGRLVILASDHGHILHRDGPNHPIENAGERWRPAGGDLGEGEVQVGGGTRSGTPWERECRCLVG